MISRNFSLIASVGLEMSNGDRGLPYLYWPPLLHGSPCRHRFIAGSSGCVAGDLSCLLAKLLGAMGGWIGGVLQHWSQPWWCGWHVDSKEFDRSVVVAWPTWCLWSWVGPGIWFFGALHLGPT